MSVAPLISCEFSDACPRRTGEGTAIQARLDEDDYVLTFYDPQKLASSIACATDYALAKARDPAA